MQYIERERKRSILVAICDRKEMIFMERTDLIKNAEAKGIKTSKFWSNTKLLKEIRSDAASRAWTHRRELYGAAGLKQANA